VTGWIAIAGGLALTVGPLRRWLGEYLVTIAHEAGHAVMTVLCSGRVLGIRLHTYAAANRTGVAGLTHSRTSLRARIPVGLAGYPAPAAIGLATLALLHTGHTRGALAAAVVAVLVMLVLIRNAFGALLLVAVGAGLYAAYVYAEDDLRAAVVGVLAWTLLLGTTRDTLRTFRSGSGDAAALGAATRIPTVVWSTLFVLLTAGATGFAAWLTLTRWAA
jgi:peptidase M50B-like protein